MARISKNGNLSGAVGNLVFVNSGPHQYVRSKPYRPKQSAKTKAAALAFGFASAQDKMFRQALGRELTLITDSRYAARHRARMSKALRAQAKQNTENAALNLGLPESLMGFDFNAQCPWEKITRFYPEFRELDTRELECHLPALQAGQEIALPTDSRTAELRLDAFTVNPLSPTIQLHLLSTHIVAISPSQATLPTVWKFGIPEEPAWLVVTGTLIFKAASPHGSPSVHGSSTYLFAKTV